MNYLFELYKQQFRTTFAMMLQYRAMLAIWMTWHVVEPVVYLIVWSVVSNTSGGSVGDYTTRGFAAYFIVMMLVNQITYTWIMYEYEYRVREGSLSFLLLKPVHPIHSDIADNISAKMITVPLMFVVAALLSVLFKPSLTLFPWAVAAFIPALLLAFAMRFLLEWTLALSAFWITRTGAVTQMYSVMVLFLSGQFAPLELFPYPIRVAAGLLPFRWMISFPVELILGRLTPAEVWIGLTAQVVWLVFILALFKFVWRAGVRIYSAVGA